MTADDYRRHTLARVDEALDLFEALMEQASTTSQDLRTSPTVTPRSAVQLFRISEMDAITAHQRARIDALLARHQRLIRQ